MAQMANVRDSSNVTYDPNHDFVRDNEDFEPVSYAGDKYMPQSHGKAKLVGTFPVPVLKNSDNLLNLYLKSKTFRFEAKSSDRETPRHLDFK
jgi:hypothetical protein